MRLKTKFQDEDFDLGEVVEANVYYGGNGRIKVIAEPVRGGMITFYFETLKGMNEMFEDAEEPKKYWYIEGDGDIHSIRTELCDELEIHTMKQIGNYFDTREEAEKAVEKLKAWKRLKDKGFRFNAWKNGILLDEAVAGQVRYEFPIDNKDDIEKDLDLLFCPGVKNEKLKED